MSYLESTGELRAFTVTQDFAIMGMCGIHVVEHLHFDDLGPQTTPNGSTKTSTESARPRASISRDHKQPQRLTYERLALFHRSV